LSLLFFSLIFSIGLGFGAGFGASVSLLLLIFIISGFISLPLWGVADWLLRKLIARGGYESSIYSVWVLLTALVIYAAPTIIIMLTTGGRGSLSPATIPAGSYVLVAIARYYFFLRTMEKWRNEKAEDPLAILAASSTTETILL